MTALCLYGLPRHFFEAYIANKPNFYDLNDLDVFFHCWHDPVNEGQRYTASAGQDGGFIEFGMESKLVDLYKPKRHRVDKQIQFDTTGFNIDGMTETPFLFSNFSSTYSLKQVGQLVSEWEIEKGIIYDLVVATRFDYTFYEPIDLSLLDNSGMNCVDTGLGLTYALCDQFFASNSANMKIMSSLHSAMFHYFRTVGTFNAERNAFNLMRDNNIQVGLLPWKSKIYGRETNGRI